MAKARGRVLAAVAALAVTTGLCCNKSCGAVSYQLTFEDPAGTYSAYYAGISSNFLAAGAEWATHFNSNVSLSVVVRFTTVVPRSSCPSITTNLVGKNGALSVYEQGAGAEIRTGVDPNGTGYDMQLQLNPDYLTNNLWFDPDPSARTAPVPNNRTDAVTVFLHELAHGFGFNGWLDSYNDTLPGNYESTFDRLTTFDGTNFWFVGPRAEAYYGGPVPLTYGDLNHVGNSLPRPGSELIPDLMNGVVFYYGTRYDISTLDLLMMADTGLPVVVPEPAGIWVTGCGLLGWMLLRRNKRVGILIQG